MGQVRNSTQLRTMVFYNQRGEYVYHHISCHLTKVKFLNNWKSIMNYLGSNAQVKVTYCLLSVCHSQSWLKLEFYQFHLFLETIILLVEKIVTLNGNYQGPALTSEWSKALPPTDRYHCWDFMDFQNRMLFRICKESVLVMHVESNSN